MKQCNIGKINSIQSLGTLDGPGLRYVVFMQGCNLRCHCCHNPETWNINGGKEITSDEIVKKVVRYKEYFKDKGGITISGGEPLLQSEFVLDVFKKCHQKNIKTCLDTSGSIFNEEVKELLKETDRVLLDIKYCNDFLYEKYVGCKLNNVIEFLTYLNSCNINVTLRQVIIPSINDNDENINFISKLKDTYRCIDNVEFLGFKKMCQSKYDNLNIEFKFKDIAEPNDQQIKELNEKLN